ncbi:MAG TPA: class I SAM-dependent methyltransferase [Bacteroidales bacterium]|nr:class I SAM-dependent methyltransferase [Bacteroidales bacterium]
MNNTGERQHSETIDRYAIEHLHRYAFAMQYIQGKDIIDIASGEGYGANLMSSVAKSVVGVDISHEAVEFANTKYKKPNVSYKQGSATQIPLPDSSIDVVVSFETIEHHDKHDEMMQEIKRILKPNGILIMSTPQKAEDGIIRHPYHVKELYFEEFKELLHKYFLHTHFLFQKSNFASIITTNQNSNFIEYSGDFATISQHFAITKPMYNMVIAGNGVIPASTNSCFDGALVWKQMENDYWTIIHENNRLQKTLNEIQHSISFKIGRIVLFPFSLLKKLFRK